ncbi:MAG TPA: hypothetical protein VNO30_43675 [Kofleriaceae bacterium]|nr:hypothetical protein [Kofleriaceae bacterium]
MGGRRVQVFHISDLHMRSTDGPQKDRARLEADARWRVLGEKWTANLAELRKDGVPFDLVVFTGDLGDWGHATDYPRAISFLKQTCAALDVPLERLMELDSAWLAGDDRDGGQLWLTEHQLSLLTTTADGDPLPGFRLALMHHRLADLADGADARKRLSDRVDLLLHGHQHEPTAEVFQGPDNQLLVLAAGCLYEGDEEHRYLNTCQVFEQLGDVRARAITLGQIGDVLATRGEHDRALIVWSEALAVFEHLRAPDLIEAARRRIERIQGQVRLARWRVLGEKWRGNLAALRSSIWSCSPVTLALRTSASGT